jgi:hypothetical protein
MATWKRTHSRDYAAYVIQRADGAVEAWIEQAGSERNNVRALTSAGADGTVGHETRH